MTLKGYINNKPIIVYDGIKCSEKEYLGFIKELSKLEILRKLSELSSKIFASDDTIHTFNDIPLTEFSIQEISTDVLKYAYGKNNDLTTLLNLYYETKKYNKTDPEETFMAMSHAQFIYQHTILNQIARTILIYNEYWDKTKYETKIDIEHSIKEITNLSFKELLMIALMYLGASKDSGFFRIIYHPDGHSLFEKNQIKFLKWCAADYSYFKTYNKPIPPLLNYPIIQTKEKPLDTESEVYIIPSFTSLLYKITNGLYFSLSDHYSDGKKGNSFKTHFGNVFEHYIGELLNNSFKTWKVSPEIRYNNSDSVDWLIYKNDNVILIEVKQSSIFLASKNTGEKEQISKDTETTIKKAIKQLYTTCDRIKKQDYKEFCFLKNIKNFEHIVVTYDPIYNANSTVKEIIKKNIDKKFLSMADKTHIININDFENILYLQSEAESLFDILSYKNLEPKQKALDFKEYILETFNFEEIRNPFLDDVYNNVCGETENMLKNYLK